METHVGFSSLSFKFAAVTQPKNHLAEPKSEWKRPVELEGKWPGPKEESS